MMISVPKLGQLPPMVMLPSAPLWNLTIATPLMSTGEPHLSYMQETSTAGSFISHIIALSMWAPLSYICPPPESLGSCRHFPVVPLSQLWLIQPVIICTLPQCPASRSLARNPNSCVYGAWNVMPSFLPVSL